MKILDITPTPNPDAIRITVNETLAGFGEFISTKVTPDHPLVKCLSERPSVIDVFASGNSLTVRFDPSIASDGREELKWVGSVLREYEHDHYNEVAPDLQTFLEDEDDNPTLQLIRSLITKEVMPYLRSHGGSIQIIGMNDQKVLVRYLGACGGCPASTEGTLRGIEALIRSEIDPELSLELV